VVEIYILIPVLVFGCFILHNLHSEYKKIHLVKNRVTHSFILYNLNIVLPSQAYSNFIIIF
jgi:hypothetical protein